MQRMQEVPRYTLNQLYSQLSDLHVHVSGLSFTNEQLQQYISELEERLKQRGLAVEQKLCFNDLQSRREFLILLPRLAASVFPPAALSCVAVAACL